jgi:glutamine cyclotransferase
VVRSYPHDTQAFTEGLLYRDGVLYESTGLNGKSSIRKVDLASGKVLQSKDIPPQYFGEGLTAWGDTLVGLTWQTQTGFVFDLKTFELKSQFAYPGEGWGLTHNGKELIMSDGSATLRFLDPKTFLEVRRVKVTADGIAVDQLNELEVVEGEIYANIWHTNTIARIDPATGKITGWIDFSKLYPDAGKGQRRKRHERHRLRRREKAPVRHRQAVAEDLRSESHTESARDAVRRTAPAARRRFRRPPPPP